MYWPELARRSEKCAGPAGQCLCRGLDYLIWQIVQRCFNGFRKCAWRLNSGRDLELVYQLFDCVLDGNTGDDDVTVYENDGRDCWTYDDFDKTNEGPRPGNRIEFDSDSESLSWMELAAAL